ncbi:MAG: class I SAM-dependent methyltransferase [Desulfococcaceae bacterium]|jgi:SAM-dependent methyltransferase|nr:class I SAM-dependent methyltransferase [Desulfococcaceae bacterium]
MDDYKESDYGEKIADIYDDLYHRYSRDLTDTLQELSNNGRVLELGIGTGRIALPLARKGVEIFGIDASPSMVAKMKAKPDGDAIPVKIANFADFDIEGTFSLIFVVFNTFLALTSQKEQIKCFQNVANHLTENGVFAVEVFYPELKRFNNNQNVSTVQISGDSVMLDVCIHDPVNQHLNVRHVVLNEGKGITFYPVQLRYVWPSELDLMANLAGLHLKHRWSSWKKEPFLSDSKNFISIYGRKET